MFKFKPEDFISSGWPKDAELFLSGRELAAKLANAKLKEWLASAPVVIKKGIYSEWKPPTPEYLFKAKLVCIRRLKK